MAVVAAMEEEVKMARAITVVNVATSLEITGSPEVVQSRVRMTKKKRETIPWR